MLKQLFSNPAGRVALGLALLVLLVLAGRGLARSASAPEPRVLAWLPGASGDVPTNTSVEFVFDQPMDVDSLVRALRVEPTASVTLRLWSETIRSPLPTPTSSFVLRPSSFVSPLLPQRIYAVLQPTSPLLPGRAYTFTLTTAARTTAGRHLAEPFVARFVTAGRLTASITPRDGEEVFDERPAFRVHFSDKMVDGRHGDDGLRDDGLRVLTIDPPVRGQGIWTSPADYEFHAEVMPATRYTLTVPAGLTALDGRTLMSDTVAHVVTTRPRIGLSYPSPYERFAPPDTTIVVDFTQPMNVDEAQSHLRVTTAVSESVAGAWSWPSDRQAVFRPARRLTEGATYRVSVTAGALPAQGELGTPEDASWTFTVAPEPQLVWSSPADGDFNARTENEVTLDFSAPMDTRSVERALRITPAPDPAHVNFRWERQNTRAIVNLPIDPSAEYRLLLSEGAVDGLGRPLLGNRSIVFRSAPLPAMTYLVGPRGYWNGTIGTYNPVPRVRQYTQARNVEQLHFTLSVLDPAALMAAYKNPWEKVDLGKLPHAQIAQWTRPVSGTLNKYTFVETEVPTPDEGVYLLEVTGDDGATTDARVLVVSRANLALKVSERQVLVWATDLNSGEPISGLDVNVLQPDGKQLARGVTDAQGVFVAPIQGPKDDDERWRWVYGESPVYVIGRGAGGLFAMVSSTWSEGIRTRDFQMPMSYGEAGHTVFLYTDRPIYRSGQTVYFKGVARKDDDGRFSLPGFKTVPVVIRDAQNNEVFRKELPLTEFGTFFGQIKLGDEAPLGEYSLLAEVPGELQPARGSFRVAEYRKPEFRVTASAPTAAIQGDVITVTVQADYYFGAPMQNARVEWRMASSDYRFNLPDQWYSFADWDEYYWMWGRESDYSPGLYADGRGTTDAQGRFVFSVPVDLSKVKHSQSLAFEVTVVDENHQAVSAHTATVAHKSHLYIGARSRYYVARPNEPLEIQLVAADPDRKMLAGVPLTVTLVERQWRSVRVKNMAGQYFWENSIEERPIATQTVTTTVNGLVNATVIPPRGGTYKVLVTARDAKGDPVRASTYFWTWGAEYVNWGVQNNDRITLVTDKRSYKPGDVAEVLVTAPFSGSTALVTMERGGVLTHTLMRLNGTSEILRVPIAAEDAPNAFVSVSLVKGRSRGFPTADFKVGYAALQVALDEQRLRVEITPDKKKYAPGETATYTIRVTDHQGRPVRAEASLSLVDAAVLALVGDADSDIVSAFYRQRGLGVHNAQTLVLSVDRINQYLDPQAKGGGGGEGFDVRTNFADTAYWNAAVRTDENGVAVVQVKLPDNLTTWRMRAKVVSMGAALGQAETDVITTKDILIRPVLPRFLTIGDTARVGAIVHNYTSVTQTIDVDGRHGDGGLPTRSLTIASGGSASAYWTVDIPKTQQATFQFTARPRPEGSARPFGSSGDAVRLTIPVVSFVEVTPLVTHRPITDVLTYTIPLANADRDADEIAIEVIPSIASSLESGLEKLAQFPYGCVEQTMSGFLPDVAVARAQQLGLANNPAFREKLAQMIEHGLQRLYGYQHNDGGWGWWKDDTSNPSITAYVLYGLRQTELAGYKVDQNVRTRAIQFLHEWLKRSRIDDPIGQVHGAEAFSSGANVRAYALYVLAELGQPDPGLTGALYEQRSKLDRYGLAYLAMALYLGNGNQMDARVTTVLDELRQAATVEGDLAHWQDIRKDYWGMGTSVRTTAIALSDLARIASNDPLASQAVRWLMTQRRDGAWGTTQETSMAIIALVDHLSNSRELQPDFTYVVLVNGKERARVKVTRENLTQATRLVIPLKEIPSGDAEIRIVRLTEAGQTGAGQLYASITFKHRLAGAEVRARYARNNGLAVSRTYAALGSGTPISATKLGEVVQVTVTVNAPQGGQYVLVEDPLPAGLEPIDTSLATSQQVKAGRKSWVWTRVELRDDRVALFATYLSPGAHTFTYLARATTSGTFRVLPAHAEMMYAPEVSGRTEGGVFEISE